MTQNNKIDSLIQKTLALGLIPISIVLLAFLVSLNGFPMGDIGAHGFEIVAMNDYGYLQPVPEMENGEYKAGIYYFPLSWLITSSLYGSLVWLGLTSVNAITIATYGLMIVLPIILIWLSKKHFNSWLLGIGFVSLTLFNSPAINTLFESTRFGAIFAYILFVVFLFKIFKLLEQKQKIVFKDFAWLCILWSLINLSYVNVGLGASLLLIGFMVVNRETFKWFYVPILAFLPNLVWLYPYYEAFQKGVSIATDSYIVTSVPILFVALMGFLLFLLFSILVAQDNKKILKFLLIQFFFYLIIFVLKGVLVFPIFFLDRFIFALHLVNLIFITIFFLFKHVQKIGFQAKSVFPIFLVVLVLFSGTVTSVKHFDMAGKMNYFDTPCHEANWLVDYLEEPFIVRVKDPCIVSLESFIYVDSKKTNYLSPVGYAVSGEHQDLKNNLDKGFSENNCFSIRSDLHESGVKSVLCSYPDCNALYCLEPVAWHKDFEVRKINFFYINYSSQRVGR